MTTTSNTRALGKVQQQCVETLRAGGYLTSSPLTGRGSLFQADGTFVRDITWSTISALQDRKLIQSGPVSANRSHWAYDHYVITTN